SPASTTRLSFTSVSAATREVLSCFRIASSTASEIWSATLSGWPSETDSEVKRNSLIVCFEFASKKGLQGYQMSRFLMSLAARFPLSVLQALGALLGWAIYGLSPTYRRHLRENLEVAGYRDAATRRAAIASAGRMVAELPAAWLRPRAEAAALVRRIEGRELVEAARAAGK